MIYLPRGLRYIISMQEIRELIPTVVYTEDEQLLRSSAARLHGQLYTSKVRRSTELSCHTANIMNASNHLADRLSASDMCIDVPDSIGVDCLELSEPEIDALARARTQQASRAEKVRRFVGEGMKSVGAYVMRQVIFIGDPRERPEA